VQFRWIGSSRAMLMPPTTLSMWVIDGVGTVAESARPTPNCPLQLLHTECKDNVTPMRLSPIKRTFGVCWASSNPCLRTTSTVSLAPSPINPQYLWLLTPPHPQYLWLLTPPHPRTFIFVCA
jgi:hypothetical protein